VLPDRILAGEELTRKRFGDDDLGRMAGPLIAAETAALQERNSERGEVPGIALAVIGNVALSRG
jgi:hypothetical protein